MGSFPEHVFVIGVRFLSLGAHYSVPTFLLNILVCYQINLVSVNDVPVGGFIVVICC